MCVGSLLFPLDTQCGCQEDLSVCLFCRAVWGERVPLTHLHTKTNKVSGGDSLFLVLYTAKGCLHYVTKTCDNMACDITWLSHIVWIGPACTIYPYPISVPWYMCTVHKLRSTACMELDTHSFGPLLVSRWVLSWNTHHTWYRLRPNYVLVYVQYSCTVRT